MLASSSNLTNSRPVATHVLLGILGSGKTTLLGQLMARRPPHEKWAILINEFGQIGLDAALLIGSGNTLATAGDDFIIREIAGGCVCCSSQLPLDVALMRLLKSVRPDRLWIEPTGLADPRQLIDHLTEPQWLTALSLRQVIGLVPYEPLQADARLAGGLPGLLEVADLLYLTHLAHLPDSDIAAAFRSDQSGNDQPGNELLASLPDIPMPAADRWLPAGWLTQPDLWQRLDQAHGSPERHYQPLQGRFLHPGLRPALPTPSNDQSDISPPPLPYRYQQTGLDHQVCGWQFPAETQFDSMKLLDWLFSLQHWQRIKGVLHTEQGWLSLNLLPGKIGFQSHPGHVDNRLEIIWPSAQMPELTQLDAALSALLLLPVSAGTPPPEGR